jgi:hypothetical protein
LNKAYLVARGAWASARWSEAPRPTYLPYAAPISVSFALYNLAVVIFCLALLRPLMGRVRNVFPDLHHQVDELLAVENRVVTRVTYSGTHRGRLGDVDPTGAHVEYVGAAFFRLSGGMIEEGWVVGDTQAIWRAIGKL